MKTPNCMCSDPVCLLMGCKAASGGILKTGPNHQMVGRPYGGFAPKKRGRPPKAAGDKSVPFTFVTNGDLNATIREAARASGRSISGEIEYRLERSFRDDDVAEAIWSRLVEGQGEPIIEAKAPPE